MRRAEKLFESSRDTSDPQQKNPFEDYLLCTREYQKWCAIFVSLVVRLNDANNISNDANDMASKIEKTFDSESSDVQDSPTMVENRNILDDTRASARANAEKVQESTEFVNNGTQEALKSVKDARDALIKVKDSHRRIPIFVWNAGYTDTGSVGFSGANADVRVILQFKLRQKQQQKFTVIGIHHPAYLMRNTLASVRLYSPHYDEAFCDFTHAIGKLVVNPYPHQEECGVLGVSEARRAELREEARLLASAIGQLAWQGSGKPGSEKRVIFDEYVKSLGGKEALAAHEVQWEIMYRGMVRAALTQKLLEGKEDVGDARDDEDLDDEDDDDDDFDYVEAAMENMSDAEK